MSENENKLQRPRLEHVALAESSSAKISNWLNQAAAKKRGLKISRKDFINWLIDKTPDNLSNGDFSSLIERFYNDAQFLRQLLRDVNAAKAEGKADLGFELVVKQKRAEIKADPTEPQGTAEQPE